MLKQALSGLLGGVLGVALQLQQPALWSSLHYALLLGAGGLLAGLLWLRPPAAARRANRWPLRWALALLAGACVGVGQTGWRAAHYAAQALDPALQGIDTVITGRVASLPRRRADGELFELEVLSAEQGGQPVRLPERLQIGRYLRPGLMLAADASAPAEPLAGATRQGRAIAPEAMTAEASNGESRNGEASTGEASTGEAPSLDGSTEAVAEDTGALGVASPSQAPPAAAATPAGPARPDTQSIGWRAGEVWRFTARLRSPHGTLNPHGFDRERWLWENGIGATGTVRNGPRDAAPQRLAPASFGLAAARQRVVERIEARVDDRRTAGVLVALVAGEQSAIDGADWALFRSTGVAHLMSISGLHVTLFAWLATALIGRGWRRLARVWPAALLALPAPVAAPLGGLALAQGYALFSGWGVPAQRTVLMLAVVLGLRWLGRQWPWPVVWLVAMVAVLLLDPWALLQPGFWLSFVAVAVLFSTDPGRPGGRPYEAASSDAAPQGRLWRSLRAGRALLREQGTMTLALAPLSLLLFGQFSLVGLLANLLAIPWVTLVITPLALVGVALPLGWDLAALAVRALVVWLQWLGGVGWASVVRAIPPLPLALAGVLGGWLLVLRLPWALRLTGLVLWWPVLAWQPVRPAAGAFEVLALDVGQGGAVLVRTARHTLLYDTGPRYSADSDAGQRIVVPLLRALGEAPDAVVVSHRDSDHAGGSAAVQAEWPRARWWSSFDADPARRCLAGQRWEWDGVVFEVLHPAAALYRPDGTGLLNSNAMSCTVRVDNGRHSAWLSGDLDAGQETRLALAQPGLRASLLLAPHHGSHSSSSPVLLNTLRPHWAVVQSGYRNRFNHPSPVVLDRYRARGMRWVESPSCGAALWQSSQPDTMRCERAVQRRYWHHAGSAPAAAADAPSVLSGP